MWNNQSLERYKELYSKYVDARVGLHNYHTIFVKHLGLESATGVRKCISEMARLEKELRQAARDAYKEQFAHDKELRKTYRKQKTRNMQGLRQNQKKNVDLSE